LETKSNPGAVALGARTLQEGIYWYLLVVVDNVVDFTLWVNFYFIFELLFLCGRQCK